MKKIILIIIVTLAIAGMIFAGIMMNKEQNTLEKTLVSLNYNELKEKIDNEDSFILVYTSETCGSCQTYKPKLQRILLENDLVAYEVVAQNYTSEEEIAYLNSIASVSGTPTTVYIEKGSELGTSYRLVGDKPSSDIRVSLEKAGYLE